MSERRTNPAVEFLKQYWFLIVFSLSTKRDIRWCLGKLAVNGPIDKRSMLECAD